MDPTTAKAFIDGLFAYLKTKVASPLGQIALNEVDMLIDGLIDQYLATLQAK